MAPAEVSYSGLIELQDLVDRYNSLIHGDPAAALHSAILLDDGTAGFTSSTDIRSPSRAASICTETWWRLVYLDVRTAEIFPAVDHSSLGFDGS